MTTRIHGMNNHGDHFQVPLSGSGCGNNFQMAMNMAYQCRLPTTFYITGMALPTKPHIPKTLGEKTHVKSCDLVVVLINAWPS